MYQGIIENKMKEFNFFFFQGVTEPLSKCFHDVILTYYRPISVVSILGIQYGYKKHCVLDFFSIWLDDPHLTNKHRTQDCIALTRAILHIGSLAAHTTLNTYKPMEINIERSPQHWCPSEGSNSELFATATLKQIVQYRSREWYLRNSVPGWTFFI